MKKKKIALVSGTEQTRKTLVQQLESYMGDVVTIKSYAIDEGITDTVSADLIILSTHLISKETRPHLNPSCPVIIAQRAINYSCIDPVFFIPPGTNVLLVNDVEETTGEAIESLQNLGLDHLNFIPFYPGVQQVKKAVIAITLGEIDKVPGFVEEVIDIGPRLIDIITLTEILKKLNLIDKQAGTVTQRYLQKIVVMGKKLADSNNEIGELNKYLNQVVDSLNDGILAFSPEGEVNICNENVKEILKINHFKVQGRNIRNLIRHDKLLAFLMEDNENQTLFKINGQNLMVHKMINTKNNSIIATFKNPNETIEMEKKLKKELIKKGYVGKYTFDDIVGDSPRIIETKSIAKKLARTDAAVLIQGESGTGKELYASAIHNASPRRTGPFLAVNFSALPDNLVESELFGYEEGAFTGAKKGGKAGLFEQANGGTIFLDEIGDISIKVQARLLRVLQEKEVMRVGGARIIPVDVRVIAATNKDLVQLIRMNQFREDLYHRLKVLYLKLPPLRERKEDIKILIRHFLKAKGKSDIEIDPQVYHRLEQYDWHGNVRELKNSIDYMLAVADGKQIYLKDLPADSFFQYQDEIAVTDTIIEHNFIGHSDEYKFLLEGIYQLTLQGKIAGRKKLARLSKEQGLNLSENQIRHRLDELEEKGLLIKKRGRYGTRLTPKGERVIDSNGLIGG